MSHPQRGPAPEPDSAWLTLAHEALLDHVERGDARHALERLLSALAHRLRGPCSLRALRPDGSTRWQLSAAPGLASSPAALDGHAEATLQLPLQRLGQQLGLLQLHGEGAAAPAEPLQPVCEAMAALLLSERDPAETPPRAGHLQAMRSALKGAGTYVWEWDIDSDHLSDIDEGLQQLGYDALQIGRTQEDWNRLIHPDDRAANHEAYLRHARGEDEHYEHAYRIRARDGHWRWYQERGRIVERHADGRPRRMVGTQTDVTEQRARERSALQAAARLERIAQHVPGILYQFELDAQRVPRFSYISERARALLGLDPADAAVGIAELLRRIDPADRAAMATGMTASAAALSVGKAEFRVRLASGAVRWIRAASSPLHLDDGGTVWHGYMEDVTELRELERAHQDKAAAEAANRAKTEFLSRMSHELRTPLNAVLGFSQLLEIDRADRLSEGQRRRVKLIREAGEHLLQMIGDLLDLTRIESGSLQVQLDTVPLRALAEESLSMLRPQADAAQVRLALQLQGDDLAARADRTRLRQVLLNLLSNAIKYNRSGGSVELRIAPAAAPDDARALSIVVQDTGVGIAEADLPHLFEPFNRLSQARGEVEGTGIGLSVTRALVALMQGRVEVSSRLGIGSRFEVTLPRA
ncbi:MAG TPA: PAS domain-containing protein [Rubrivivax sp.]|nr:PAS domain-containing protein [Rubrivivax sp.]